MNTTRRSAFTLMELMISVALALLLILGINEVFGLTSKTVGAGQALTSAYQNDRAAQLVMSQDFKNEVGAAPLIITSQYLAAFRSRQDQQANKTTTPNVFDPIGQTNTTVLTNAISPRNHRMDTIGMCVRDQFERQTGNSTSPYIAPGTSYEAYVWYGHLNVADNGKSPSFTPAWSNSTLPGLGAPSTTPVGSPAANPNNFYANQWVLGRVAMLLQTSPTLGYMKALTYNSKSDDNSNTVQSSLYDVASGTIDSLTAGITPTTTGWYAGNNLSLASSPPTGTLNYRFQCDPAPPRGTTPGLAITSNYAAFSVPAFLKGCSQFCVEFAGDFTVQDPTTGAASAGQDGVTDFTVSTNGTRQIRWYGMPRSVIGDGTVNVNRGDVVRVQDVVSATTSGYTFERTAIPGGTYVAAWHPAETNNPRPKLIRITLALEDPNTRLGDAITFQYIFAVQ